MIDKENDMAKEWIAEPVEFQDLRPNAPFYLINPLSVKKPAFAQVHYTCEDLSPETIVWTLYEPWRKTNPWVNQEIIYRHKDGSQLGNLINLFSSDYF